MVNLPLPGPPTFKYIEAYLVDQGWGDMSTFRPLWMQIEMAEWLLLIKQSVNIVTVSLSYMNNLLILWQLVYTGAS